MTKFQVERRPITPTGAVVRGGGKGDYLLAATDAKVKKLLAGGTKINIQGWVMPGTAKPEDFPAPLSGDYKGPRDQSNFIEIIGEPWLISSSHYSIESAIESASTLASALGAENVRIVKVLDHRMQFKLN